MSKIKMVELDDAKGATKDLYDASTAMIGRVPHSVRVLGNIPMVSKFFLLFSAVMQREGAGSYLSSKIKEIVIIKIMILLKKRMIKVIIQILVLQKTVLNLLMKTMPPHKKSSKVIQVY